MHADIGILMVWKDLILDGCFDIDLGFSSLTNTLPIRRLKLEVGASWPVRAAWVPVPGFDLYESGGGRFVADLEVDEESLVIEYPGFWRLTGIPPKNAVIAEKAGS